MLREIHVQDLALIEEAWLEFGSGLTVLTGETGAGKTALIGAIKLLVGERADSSLVRSGAAEAVVEGRVEMGDSEIVARRRLSADGRSRCTIDGTMATVGELASGLGHLFDLHGQHEHQALLTPSRHVGYLDRFAGDDGAQAAEAYGEAQAKYADAKGRLGKLQSEISEAQQRADYLRFIVEEVDRVAPELGEDATIEARLPKLRHGEKLANAANEGFVCLRGDGAATDRLAEANSALQSVAGLDPALDELAQRLTELSTLLDESGSELREYGEGIEHDPAALNDAEDRLAALTTLKKKYGPDLSDVLKMRDESESRLDSLATGDAELTKAQERVERSSAAVQSAGSDLAAVRKRVAPDFTKSLAETVEELALSGARFEVAFTDLPFEQWTEEGPHGVEFLFSSAPDQPTKPLAKIASGGEISRVMLALKGVLGSADEVPVLVFDEVDAGIGGSAAGAVGRRLAELSATHQVLVVTHLPQVAVYADTHLVVEKSEVDGTTRTVVRAVESDHRVTEIARMLSGDDTDAGRAHAEELLSAAKR